MKKLTILWIFAIGISACGRRVEVREYVEVRQAPPVPGMAADAGSAELPEVPPGLRAAPLTVEAVPENLPPGHPTLAGVPPGLRAPPLTVEAVPENLPPGHPTLAGVPSIADPNVMKGREGEVPPAAAGGDLTWTLPRGWQENPGGGMRLAEFVPGGEAEGALATLIPFSGAAGSLEANLARWRGQVGLPPIAYEEPRTLQGKIPFFFVSFLDESRELKLPSTTLAAIYRLPQRTVFLKFTGPTDVVAAHKLDFLELAGSLRSAGDTP